VQVPNNPTGSKGIDREPKPSGSFKAYKRFPILVFEIDESGAVQNVKIKDNSTSFTADEMALCEVRRWKYKPRHSCGIVESHATVAIDFA